MADLPINQPTNPLLNGLPDTHTGPDGIPWQRAGGPPDEVTYIRTVNGPHGPDHQYLLLGTAGSEPGLVRYESGSAGTPDGPVAIGYLDPDWGDILPAATSAPRNRVRPVGWDQLVAATADAIANTYGEDDWTVEPVGSDGTGATVRLRRTDDELIARNHDDTDWDEPGVAVVAVQARMRPDRGGVRVHWDSRYDLHTLDGDPVEGAGWLSRGVFVAPTPEAAIRRLQAAGYEESGLIDDTALHGLGVRKSETLAH
ncbi:hypothetical protein DVS28_b0304 (plasmid) [Euzebya pacifica]|uniref:Uncharacterized protein n=2 Tax=Euzebya pacifica TaxID=1608957 RepID=A0A346Y6H7_9ACTN|nr:hypothetical protein DVS28_b0304 [Euzebya pacifica]